MTHYPLKDNIFSDNPEQEPTRAGFGRGLKKAGEVRGKTGLINFQTGNTGDKKAEKKLSEKQKLSKELDDIILNNINRKVATMLHSSKSYSDYLKKVQDRKMDPFEAADKISNGIVK